LRGLGHLGVSGQGNLEGCVGLKRTWDMADKKCIENFRRTGEGEVEDRD